MQQPIQDTVRFFELLFKQTVSEVAQIAADAQQDLQFESKQIFDLAEVYDKIQALAAYIKQLLAKEQEKVPKLVGSLTLQLTEQAEAQGAQIAPIINSLEEESKLKLFAKGNDVAQGGKAIQNTNLVDQAKKVQELEAKLAHRDAECEELRRLLYARVDEAPQYQNLVKMLKKKNAEIEELRGEK